MRYSNSLLLRHPSRETAGTNVVQALEYAGTAEAAAVLRGWAGDGGRTLLGRECRAALRRLEDLPVADGHAYVSGPPAMVSRTVRALRELGAPPERIEHDGSDLDPDPAVVEPAPVGAAGLSRS